jgi:hypothetical protein
MLNTSLALKVYEWVSSVGEGYGTFTKSRYLMRLQAVVLFYERVWFNVSLAATGDLHEPSCR